MVNFFSRFCSVSVLSSFMVAYGATSTTTFTVSASVLDNCTVNANNLSFSNYDPTSGLVTDGTTTVSVTCTLGTPYQIGLNAGIGSGATVNVRKMTRTSGGVQTLNYSLYQDASHSVVWGNTLLTDTVTGTGTGLQQNVSVYGRIFASQNVPVASYQDTITATVTF